LLVVLAALVGLAHQALLSRRGNKLGWRQPRCEGGCELGVLASPALTLDVSRSSVLPTSICRVPPSFSEISHGRVPGKRSIDGLRTCDATLEQAPKVVGGAGGNKDSAIEMSATDGSQQTSEEGDHEIYELVSLQRVECAQWNNQRSSTRVYACSNMTCTLWHHSDCITVVGERVRRLIGEAIGEAIARARWMEANKHVKRRRKNQRSATRANACSTM
jgi:hypothetical protein